MMRYYVYDGINCSHFLTNVNPSQISKHALSYLFLVNIPFCDHADNMSRCAPPFHAIIRHAFQKCVTSYEQLINIFKIKIDTGLLNNKITCFPRIFFAWYYVVNMFATLFHSSNRCGV